MSEQKDIKYVGREFEDFRQQLIEFTKNYFPDTYADFSPASPGMMFMEMAAYVGDVLSFYQDTQIQETFLQYAKNPENLYTLAYALGYRPKVTTASRVELTFSQIVDKVSGSSAITLNQALRIPEGTVIPTRLGTSTFVLDSTVDFAHSGSVDPTDIVEEELGGVSVYRLTKKATATSANIKTLTRSFTTAERFTTIEIEDSNIIGVLDITDSSGEKWYEVPYLGQNTVFEETYQSGNYGLDLKNVSKRFVSRFTSKNKLQIQFGAGIKSENTELTYFPNPGQLSSGSIASVNKLDVAYDPSNFLYSTSYGLAPSNTTLTIRYMTGGGVLANIQKGGIQTTGTAISSSIQGTDLKYLNTLTIENETPASGGKGGDTEEEIRQNAMKAFAEQQRMVTLNDFVIRALSLPPKLGSVAKVFVTRDTSLISSKDVLGKNPLSISMYVLSYSGEGSLATASSTIKENLKQYLSQYMLITDSIEIKDAFIVNIGVSFEIVTLPSYSSKDVLVACNKKIQEWFEISKWGINQPINLSKLYTELDRVKGVQTVKNIRLENKVGGKYSIYSYDISGATRDNIVYPSYDPCIFELKYPNEDIKGRVTSI